VGPERRGGRPQAGCLEDPPDGGGSHTDPELAELALDPWVALSGVLPGHPNDEFADLGIDGRPAGSPPGVGPLPADQLPVPPEQRLGRDQERRPALAREGPGQGREYRAVKGSEARAPDLPSQDLQLLAEDHDLDFLGPVAPR